MGEPSRTCQVNGDILLPANFLPFLSAVGYARSLRERRDQFAAAAISLFSKSVNDGMMIN